MSDNDKQRKLKTRTREDKKRTREPFPTPVQHHTEHSPEAQPHHSPRTAWGHHGDTFHQLPKKTATAQRGWGPAGGCTAVLTSLAGTSPHISRILAHVFAAFIIPAAWLEVLGKEPVFLIISFIPDSFLSRAEL